MMTQAQKLFGKDFCLKVVDIVHIFADLKYLQICCKFAGLSDLQMN